MTTINIDQSGIENQPGGTVIGVQAGRINNLHVHGLQVSFAGLDWRPAPPPEAETLPDPGGLPPGSRLGLLRNAAFTGREGDLRALAQAAAFPPPPPPEEEDQGGEAAPAPVVNVPAPVVIALSGLCGVGKTQLVVEFCYRCGRSFYGLHWLDARQDPLAEIAACGEAMALQPWPAALPERAALTMRLWQAEGAAGLLHLAVLDNVEDEAQLRSWLPQLRGLQVIVTSQQAEWPADLGVQSLPVDELPRPASLALLRRLAPRLQAEPDAALDPLCAQLGDLPLALFLAGSYLNEVDVASVEEYLAELQAGALSHESLVDWTEHTATGPAASLLANYDLIWDRLEGEANLLARGMFLASGWCAVNTPIPPELLGQMAQEGGAAPKASHLARALKRLYALGLLEPAQGGPKIHILLGEYARSLSKEGAALARCAAALAQASFQASESGLPAKFAALRAHVEAAAKWCEAANLLDAGTLWNNLGSHLHDLADYAGAKAAYQRALALAEQSEDSDQLLVAKRANNLGTVLHELNDFSGARALFERALAILEKDAAHNSVEIAGVLNNLGSLLQDGGDLDGALSLYQRALAIDEAQFGSHSPAAARDLNNLGAVLSDQGDLLAGLDAFERALEIDERAFGQEHPRTASDITNIGGIFYRLGSLDEARIAFARALQIDELVYGLEHPVVAKDAGNLGSVLRDLGDLDGAKALFERALAIFNKFLPPEHPDTAGVRAILEQMA